MKHLLWAGMVTTFTVLLFYAWGQVPPYLERWKNTLSIAAGIAGIFAMAWAATAAMMP